ncbi:DUF433 domain-containing protein [Sphingomonas sp. Leaf343]|uniref:DUF433 domain-containing protein n=1 Tax=Sphingomonas sp. Leaf343 TaxID=1736345 RepID=UPI0006F33038|nr:DUF433 domain-containing protein [Sphingomonas sp. Leaf343]KQR83242.1 hypothetical protein ASG07_09820 [Sphingomonas sp. Leaf343]
MQLPDFDSIAIDPGVCGGRPVIAGTRMRVSDILEMLAGGATETEIVADFSYISEADIRACLSFAAHAANHPIVMAAE